MRNLKRIAVGLTAAVMMAGGAMTAMANTADAYFYLLKGGNYVAAPMGQDCVGSYDVSGDEVTLNLQEAKYVSNGQTYTGNIVKAFIDDNGNGVFDEDSELDLFREGENGNQIVYNKDPDAAGYTNFTITIDVDSAMTKTFSVYIPDLN
ncbi:hypothetical protein [Lacrimispora sp.]|uniref:hypothetical protein n=1 Tax=Lacrimispora sp. TaxID=2719234 RepID=UPI003990E9D4